MIVIAAPMGKPYRISSEMVWPIQRVAPAPGSIVMRKGRSYIVQPDGSEREYKR